MKKIPSYPSIYTTYYFLLIKLSPNTFWNQLIINVATYFYTLNSTTLITTSILMLIFHCLDYCNKFWKRVMSPPFCYFQDCFGYAESLEFSYELWNQVSILKKTVGILVAHVLNVCQVGVYYCNLNIKSPDPLCGIFFHLFKLSLVYFNNCFIASKPCISFFFFKLCLSIVFFLVLLQIKLFC